jgi:spore coat protein CotH
MKKSLFSLLFCSILMVVKAQINFVSSNLPIISIKTNGNSINENSKVVADIQIRDNKSKQNKLTDSVVYSGKIGIELRGSSSLAASKRLPYSIETREMDGKTNKNIALLGMAKENDWALIAPYSDKTLIRDAFLYTLARKMMPWAPDFRFADVFINDKYEGIYMVTEKIKQGKNRVNIDKMLTTDIAGDELTGGYIFALDKTKPTDKFFASGFKYPNGARYPEYILNSPKADVITTEQMKYISNWTKDLEKLLYSTKFNDKNEGYPKFLDVKSFVDYVILNELSRNIDAYRLSTYFYKDKDSKDTKLHAGPVWDYNLGFGNVNYCENEKIAGWAIDFNLYCSDDYWTIHFFWQRLFKDPTFQSMIKQRWQELRKGDLSSAQLKSTVDNLSATIGDAQKLHFQRYPVLNEWLWPNSVVKGSYAGEIDFLKSWTEDRCKWLDGVIGAFISKDDDSTVVNTSLVAFPNPVQEKLSISYTPNGAFEVILYDARGVLLQTVNIKNMLHKNIELEVGHLTQGLYLFQLMEEGKIIGTGKFIKM